MYFNNRIPKEKVKGYVQAMFDKYYSTSEPLSVDDILTFSEMRKAVVFREPENVVEFELLKDMIIRMATGRSMISVKQLAELYLFRDPEMRELNHGSPEATGLPLNISVVNYKQSQQKNAVGYLNELMIQKLGTAYRFSDIIRKYPIRNELDIRYMFEVMMVAVLQDSAKLSKGNPWYTKEDSGTSAHTMKTVAINYQ